MCLMALYKVGAELAPLDQDAFQSPYIIGLRNWNFNGVLGAHVFCLPDPLGLKIEKIKRAERGIPEQKDFMMEN